MDVYQYLCILFVTLFHIITHVTFMSFKLFPQNNWQNQIFRYHMDLRTSSKVRRITNLWPQRRGQNYLKTIFQALNLQLTAYKYEWGHLYMKNKQIDCLYTVANVTSPPRCRSWCSKHWPQCSALHSIYAVISVQQ